MAYDKGMGTCLIPKENGIPCGGHIGEGAPIGTIISVNQQPLVGHKACVDGFNFRKAQPVKIAKQSPGGTVGPYEDAILNPTPLEKPEPPQSLSNVPMPPGVQSVADLPFDEPEPHPARRSDPPYRGDETEPFDPKLGEAVGIRDPSRDGRNIYRDGLHGEKPKAPTSGPSADDWGTLVAILGKHGVQLSSRLLGDLIDWKTR